MAPSDPRKHLESLLIRGEVVGWSGRPLGGVKFVRRLGAWLPLGFGVALVGLAAVLTVVRPGEDEDQTPIAMALFGSFALLYGSYGTLIQAHARRRARRRFFAVTDRRVIAVDGGAVREIKPHTLRGVFRLEEPDGSGDLHVLYRPSGLDTRAEEGTLAMEGCPRSRRPRRRSSGSRPDTVSTSRTRLPDDATLSNVPNVI